MIEDMREEEIFSTAPSVPNASPTDAEIAAGFPSGEASKPFFNAVWNRFSEVLFKTQQKAEQQKTNATDTQAGADTSLIYYDTFKGLKGSDITARTSIVGASLRNDSGSGSNKYILTGHSSAIRKKEEQVPLYAACGQDSSALTLELVIGAKENGMSTVTYPDGDFVAICLGCIGAYERTEVGILGNVVYYKVYDTTNAIVAAAASVMERPFTGDKWTLVVQESGGLSISIPEINFTKAVSAFSFTVGSVATPRPVSNDHGFICSPQTFSINSFKIKDNTL